MNHHQLRYLNETTLKFRVLRKVMLVFLYKVLNLQKFHCRKLTFYNETFEDLGLYTETPTLPFATLGTLGWSHSNNAVDDGSSQFFFFLYEAELNPAGRNLIDGRNAAFGYVVDGFDVLEELTKDDKIVSIDVLEGIENLKLNA